jgi:predicted membrane channel-forming protein YqfA (hemolysin III family)
VRVVAALVGIALSIYLPETNEKADLALYICMGCASLLLKDAFAEVWGYPL